MGCGASSPASPASEANSTPPQTTVKKAANNEGASTRDWNNTPSRTPTRPGLALNNEAGGSGSGGKNLFAGDAGHTTPRDAAAGMPATNATAFPPMGKPMGVSSPLAPGMSANEISSVQDQLDGDMMRIMSGVGIPMFAVGDAEKNAAIQYFEQVDQQYKKGHLEVVDIQDIFEKLGLHLVPEQFEEYVKAMLRIADKGQDLSVTQAEFQELYHKILQSEELRLKYTKQLQKEVKLVHKEEIVAKATEIFAAHDVNNDNHVSVSELKNIMKKALELPDLSEKQWEIFVSDTLRRGDKDQDGYLDFDEFKNFYTKCLSDENVRAKYRQKVVMRFKEGTWMLEKETPHAWASL